MGGKRVLGGGRGWGGGGRGGRGVVVREGRVGGRRGGGEGERGGGGGGGGGGARCLCSKSDLGEWSMRGCGANKTHFFCAAGAQQTHIIDEAQTSVTSLTVPTRRIRRRYN